MKDVIFQIRLKITVATNRHNKILICDNVSETGAARKGAGYSKTYRKELKGLGRTGAGHSSYIDIGITC
jgi:hypothetical protein